ncbi:MAG: ribosome maturation factor RimM [Actinomycetota bacterium]|nr:ribosome maturation factor RimM [Actinomycetota bacterium]
MTEGFLHAGRVGRPHGLDGSFHVVGGTPSLLTLGTQVRLAQTTRTIVRRAGTDDRPILRLRGVDDRAGAEELRGADLLVARARAPELAEGEYWAEDLEGCDVVTAQGDALGRVERLRPLPSCEALEVGDLLVPLVGGAIVAIRLEERRIVVDGGFLGLDPPPDGARPA